MSDHLAVCVSMSIRKGSPPQGNLLSLFYHVTKRRGIWVGVFTNFKFVDSVCENTTPQSLLDTALLDICFKLTLNTHWQFVFDISVCLLGLLYTFIQRNILKKNCSWTESQTKENITNTWSEIDNEIDTEGCNKRNLYKWNKRFYVKVSPKNSIISLIMTILKLSVVVCHKPFQYFFINIILNIRNN